MPIIVRLVCVVAVILTFFVVVVVVIGTGGIYYIHLLGIIALKMNAACFSEMLRTSGQTAQNRATVLTFKLTFLYVTDTRNE
jgi:hypothetical protein